MEDGFWPGGGAIAAAVKAASDGAEPVIAGKPELPFLREAESALPGVAPAIVVGDRPASDLESAKRLGWCGALVLTGVSSVVSEIRPHPDVVLQDLSELLLTTTDQQHELTRDDWSSGTGLSAETSRNTD